MLFNVDSGSSLLETCGLCGTQNGQVIDLNGFVATTPMEFIEVANSYRTPARYQSLRPIRHECGKCGKHSTLNHAQRESPLGLKSIFNLFQGCRSFSCFYNSSHP